MNAAARVVIVSFLICVGVIVLVLYRYDIIGGKGHTSTMETTAPAPVAVTAPAAVPSPSQESNGPQPTDATPTAAQLENGKKLYAEKTCALCHGSNGAADTVSAKSLNATSFVSGKFNSNKDNLPPVQYILHVIESGVPGTAMVSFAAQIPSAQDRHDLAEYVHSLVQKPDN